MTSSDSEEQISSPQDTPNSNRDYAMFAVLVVINLLNYVDRFTIAGVLDDIVSFYSVSDTSAGLLQTAFIATYTLASPPCGYLGDRYNRKWLIVGGIAFWISAVLSSTFIPKENYVVFVGLRAFVGIGEASYAAICPALIADIFVGRRRSIALMIFNLAVPIGCGLGYMAAVVMAQATGAWQWGVRVTTIPGIICLLFTIFIVEERERGNLETSLKEDSAVEERSFCSDVWELMHNATYLISSLGFAALSFTAGVTTFFAPILFTNSLAATKGLQSTSELESDQKSSVTFITGGVVILAGLVGVIVGSIVSRFLKSGSACFKCVQTERADAIVSAAACAVACPALIAVILLVPVSLPYSFVVLFVVVGSISANFVTTLDLLMSVVPPHRRATAVGMQTVMQHALGDGSGPFVVGAISDAIRHSRNALDNSAAARCQSLLTAFYVPTGTLLLAVFLYAGAAVTFPRDQLRPDKDEKRNA